MGLTYLKQAQKEGSYIVNIHRKVHHGKKGACIVDCPSYVQEHQQSYLNILSKWSIVLAATMTLAWNIDDKDKVIYDCCLEDLTLWQTFLLSLWSFSVFAHLFYVFILKLCELLQTLTSSWLAQSLKKFQDLDPLKPTFHKHCSTLEPVDHGLKPPITL